MSGSRRAGRLFDSGSGGFVAPSPHFLESFTCRLRLIAVSNSLQQSVHLNFLLGLVEEAGESGSVLLLGYLFFS